MVSRNCWLEKIIPTVSFSTELATTGQSQGSYDA
jgi:hypothetical protein